MNPNQGPLGPGQGQQPQQTITRPFTKKALEAKFSFSWTRQQLVVITNVLNTQQFAMGDPRAKILFPMLDEIDKTAFGGLTDSDFQNEETPDPAAPANNVKVN